MQIKTLSQNVVQGASGDVYGLHILRCDPWIPEHKASNKYQEAHEPFVVQVWCCDDVLKKIENTYFVSME